VIYLSAVVLQIKQTWYHVFREKFIKRALQQCNDCKKGFYYYQHNVPNSEVNIFDMF
jgi:optic atrophy protein 1